MFVRPARKGDVIRDPHTKQPLPADGAEVADDSNFWHRRLRSGDVLLGQAPTELKAKGPKGGE